MMLEENKLITNRYSPGYCDWPVKDQQKLFSFFPEKFCGIRLSESSLMYPIKSLSGMIGIGSLVSYQLYPCDSCKDENCQYRKLRQTVSIH
jgi:cobalamin-dependent methionine synthase I